MFTIRCLPGMDDAFVPLECFFSKTPAWNAPIWCANLDKAFDRIEYSPLFDALFATRCPTLLLHFVVVILHKTDWLSSLE